MRIEMDILHKYDLDISFESETLYFVDRPLQATSYKNIIYSENSADFLLIPIQSGWMPNASYLSHHLGISYYVNFLRRLLSSL